MSIDFEKLFSKRFSLPKADVFKHALKTFSFTERFIFYSFVVILIASTLLLLERVNTSFLIEVPDHGGELIEGIVGSPRFVNPLLALSDADKDLVSLVYSGLMKATPGGTLVPDLAESYSISPDGLTYSFTLKTNARFHDGTPITTDDVVFTIEKAQDATLKSPKRANWDGVSIEKVDDREIHFVLKKPYAPFIENTALGILPKHIWKNASADEFAFSQFNTTPIGSGPFKVGSVARNSAGIPNEYTLQSFSRYVLGEPNLAKLVLKFYSNENDLVDAFSSGDIESMGGISAKTSQSIDRKDAEIEKVILPRVFGVFFNQNQAPVLANKEVRQALAIAIDKKRIVHEVLSDFGKTINGPIPPKDFNTDEISTTSGTSTDRIASAKAVLEKAGWKMNTGTNTYEKKSKKDTVELSFSIATGDAPELKSAAALIAEDWKTLGARVNVDVYETGDLNQNIIRPRKYDALFFGEIVGRDLDFYPFWHSSQRNDPGLNIALYVNSKVDKLLEDARATTDETVRNQKYQQFVDVLQSDTPVVFVYSPAYLYVVPSKVKNTVLGSLTVPAERFLNINEWYIETNKIWKIFNH